MGCAVFNWINISYPTSLLHIFPTPNSVLLNPKGYFSFVIDICHIIQSVKKNFKKSKMREIKLGNMRMSLSMQREARLKKNINEINKGKE